MALSTTSYILFGLGVVFLLVALNGKTKDGRVVSKGTRISGLIIAIVLGGFGYNISHKNASVTSSQDSGVVQQESSRSTASAQSITFKNVNINTDSVGILNVIGEATNNETEKHTFSLLVSFYDAKGKLIGTASGTMNDLEPHTTKTWNAVSTDKIKQDQIKSWKVQVDTMIE